MHRLLLFSFCVCSFMLLMLPERAHAAHSRQRAVTRREGPPRYDRSITTFSEDGRLSQVEYGMEASLRGSPIVAVVHPKLGLCVAIAGSSFGKIHRIDHHLWMVTTGLGGDGRILADVLREGCQNARLAYGESPTTHQAAKMAGKLQHELTRTGGARPLGCTAIIMGIDPAPACEPGGGLLGIPRLFQTDPGGIVEECQFCAAGKGRVELMKALSAVQSQLLLWDDVDSDDGVGGDAEGDDDNDGESGSTATYSTNIISKICKTITKILQKQIAANTNGKGNERSNMIDVWTIEPNADRRGGMRATCYQGILK